jgi:hypothetical protein
LEHFADSFRVRGPPGGGAPEWSLCPAHIENSGGANRRIAASGIVEVVQLLALKVALDRRSAVSANFLNSERGCLEHKPVYSAKNSALLVELCPLEHSSVSIRVDKNFIDRPEMT